MLRKGHCEGMKRHRRGTNTLRRPSFASFPPSFPPTFLPFSLPFSLPYLQRRLQHRLQRALVRGLARVHKLDELRHVHRTMARLAPPPPPPPPPPIGVLGNDPDPPTSVSTSSPFLDLTTARSVARARGKLWQYKPYSFIIGASSRNAFGIDSEHRSLMATSSFPSKVSLIPRST